VLPTVRPSEVPSSLQYSTVASLSSGSSRQSQLLFLLPPLEHLGSANPITDYNARVDRQCIVQNITSSQSTSHHALLLVRPVDRTLPVSPNSFATPVSVLRSHYINEIRAEHLANMH
jgi:hypothetical protein